MQRTYIRDLKPLTGQTAVIHGWVHIIRDQKSMLFLVIRDNTGMVQVTVDKAQTVGDAAPMAACLALTRESAVTISGRVVENPVVKLGGIELLPDSIQVESLAQTPLPLDPQAKVQPGIDVRLDWRYLDLRRPENLLSFQVQTTVEMAMREFWVQEGFVEIHSPKLIGTASESGAEVFELEYFGRSAYLAQSPQFYKQMAIAAGFDRVYEIGPAFRADPSFTPRHATEFTSVDMEIGWIGSHFDVMASQERWLRYTLEQVQRTHGDAIRERFGVEVEPPVIPFPKVTMAEAHEILRQQGYTVPAERKGDLDPQGERLLGEYARKTYGHDFLYVIDWPKSVRSFYHMRYPDAPNITKSFDLLYKGVEVATGAQREHRYDVLVAQALDKGFKLEPLQFYLDFFKYGCPPHGGYGFGSARLVAGLLNR
ncbi:MAG: aspartate--tRNA(Asn) ligase, partial [Anaerolineae bacterium]